MVNTNTVVNAPMELYPVYRASAVIVQSNIDANLDNPDSVRSLSRTDSGDQISLEVRATAEVVGKDGTKYDFVGWSRDYESDSKYTLMTEDDKYPLEGSEPFKGATYTAVYKVTPYKVRYHSVDGAVIFTATVDSGDERAQDGKPGFVYTVDVPKMDESGNPVYDNDGNPVMEQNPWRTTRTPTPRSSRCSMNRLLPMAISASSSWSGDMWVPMALQSLGMSSRASQSRVTWTCIL